MQKVILFCDRCETGKDVKSFRINRGTEMDPSGNGYNNNWEYKDYCPECFVVVKKSDPELKIQPKFG